MGLALLQKRWLIAGAVFCLAAYFVEAAFSNEFHSFELMQPRAEYDLGKLEVGDDIFELAIVNLPSIRFKDHSFYVIHFKLNHNKVGEITLIRESEQLLFQGIVINESMRNMGLSKPFLKVFFSFGVSMGYKVATTQRQRKPLVNLQLLKFGLSPAGFKQ